MCETLCQVQSNLIRATLRFSCSPFNETSRRASRARGIKLSTLYLVSEHFCLNQIHFFFLLAKTTTPMIPHYLFLLYWLQDLKLLKLYSVCLKYAQ